MTRHWIGNVLVAGVLVFGTLAGAPGRMFHPGPWVAFLAGCALLLTQPPLGPAQMVRDRGDRLSGLGIFAAVIACQLAAVVQFGYRAQLSPDLLSLPVIVGIFLTVAGLAMRVSSIRTLGRYFTSTVQVQAGQRLIDHGPYRLVRHPSYTGTLVATSGVATCLASPLGIALVAVAVLPAYLYRIHVEESALVADLGDAYETYRRRTKRLIPWIL